MYLGAIVRKCKDKEELEDLMLAHTEDSHQGCGAAGYDQTSLNTSAKDSCSSVSCVGQSTVLNEFGRGKNKALSNRKGRLKAGMKRSLDSIRESGRGVKRCQPSQLNGSVKVQDLSGTHTLSNANMRENTVKAVEFMANGIDAEKSVPASHEQQFKDVPVPIKKRRIQMVETMQSQSLPSWSISPGCPSLNPPPLSAFPKCPSSLAEIPSLSSQPSKFASPTVPTPKSQSPLSSSPVPLLRSSSPRSPFPEKGSPLSSIQAPPASSPSLASADPSAIYQHLPNSCSSGCELNVDVDKLTGTCSGSPHFNKQGLGLKPALSPIQSLSPTFSNEHKINKEETNEGSSFASAPRYSVLEDLDTAVVSQVSARETRTNGAVNSNGQHACLEDVQGVSEGQSKSGFCQDDRLHWDLNKEMEAWERLTDQTTVTEVKDENRIEVPCASISVDSNDSKHIRKAEAVGKLLAHENLELEKCQDVGTLECKDEDDQSAEACKIISMVQHDRKDWRAVRAEDNDEYDEPASWEDETPSDQEANEKAWVKEELSNDTQAGFMLDAELEKDITSSTSKAAGWDQVSGEVDPEENIDNGESELRHAEGLRKDVDKKASVVLQSDIHLQAVVETGNLQDKSARQEFYTVSNDAQEKSGLCEEGLRVSFCESQLSETSLKNDANSGRSKFTGWDRGPEGFGNVEDAWKMVEETFPHNFHGRRWASSQRRSTFSDSKVTRRRSRFGSRHSASRASFASVRGGKIFCDPDFSGEQVNVRKSFHQGMWMDDWHNRSSKLSPYRDRRPGRKSRRGAVNAFHGMGRTSMWTEPDDSLDEWGSGRRHVSAAALAAAKVESSGFVVAPDGTITKHRIGIASNQGAIQSTDVGRQYAPRSMTNMRKGCVDIESAGVFPSRAHVGPSRGMAVTSSSADMNCGGRGFGQTDWQGYVRSMAQTGKTGGHEISGKYQRSFLGCGDMEHENGESPYRPLQRSDHALRSSHISQSFIPEMKVEKLNTTMHHPLVHSKLGPSGVAVSQGSSSPSFKWAYNTREQETLSGEYFEQIPPLCCLPLKRAPYVTQLTSFVDELNEQVLPEAQCFLPMRAGLNPTISSGKLGNCGLEIMRLSENEDNDSRVTGSRSRGDYNRTSLKDGNEIKLTRETLFKRSMIKNNDGRQGSSNLPSKGGRSIRSHKCANTQEEEDEVAPRRRRTS